MDYNINFSHCIKEAHSFGSDTYANICSGVNHVVAWGSMDYFYNVLGLIVTSVIAMALVAAGVALAYGIYFSWKEYQELST